MWETANQKSGTSCTSSGPILNCGTFQGAWRLFTLLSKASIRRICIYQYSMSACEWDKNFWNSLASLDLGRAWVSTQVAKSWHVQEMCAEQELEYGGYTKGTVWKQASLCLRNRRLGGLMLGYPDEDDGAAPPWTKKAGASTGCLHCGTWLCWVD